jgi:hypothetical protein
MGTFEFDRTDSHYPVNQLTRNLDEEEWRSCSSAAHDIQAESMRQVVNPRCDSRKATGCLFRKTIEPTIPRKDLAVHLRKLVFSYSWLTRRPHLP